VKRAAFALILLAAPALSFGQAPPVTPPVHAVATSKPNYPSGSVVYVDATGSTTGKDWPVQIQVIGRPNEPKGTLDGGMGAIFPALPDGIYTIVVSASGPLEGQKPAIDNAAVSVTVGTPPTPTPTKDPIGSLSTKIDALTATINAGFTSVLAKLDAKPIPTPTPVTPPSPTTVGNMRVLVLYDSGAAMSAAQRNVLFSTTSVIPYLNAKCMKGTDGRAGWRFLDPTTPLAGDAGEWQDLMNKAKADTVAIPKIVVFAGNTIAGSRMVTSEADALSYLQSLGGK
jgi:hypothetical protein